MQHTYLKIWWYICQNVQSIYHIVYNNNYQHPLSCWFYTKSDATWWNQNKHTPPMIYYCLWLQTTLDFHFLLLRFLWSALKLKKVQIELIASKAIYFELFYEGVFTTLDPGFWACWCSLATSPVSFVALRCSTFAQHFKVKCDFGT